MRDWRVSIGGKEFIGVDGRRLSQRFLPDALALQLVPQEVAARHSGDGGDFLQSRESRRRIQRGSQNRAEGSARRRRQSHRFAALAFDTHEAWTALVEEKGLVP